jgi:hypothetical protein
MTEDERAIQDAEAARLSELHDLRRAQELRRILGDPRRRVEVPTENTAGQPPITPAAKRYQIG